MAPLMHRESPTKQVKSLSQVYALHPSVMMQNSLPIFGLALSIVIVRLFSFMVELEACLPPPSVMCSSSGCRNFNYQGIFDQRATCIAPNSVWPKSEEELRSVVAYAVKTRRKIKLLSKLIHSESKVSCARVPELIVSTEKYAKIIAIDRRAMTITVQAGAIMDDVTEAAAKAGLAVPAMIYWNGVSAAGIFTTGSHGSGFAEKGSGVYEYVTKIRLIVPAFPGEGFAKIVTLTEADEDFKAAKLSLGTLGAISEITFALEPMYKRSVNVTVKDDSNLENEAESFLRASEFGDIFWVPTHSKAIFRNIERVSVDVTGDGRFVQFGTPTSVAEIELDALYYDKIQAEGDGDAICKVLEEKTLGQVNKGIGFVNGDTFTGYPVVGFNHRMQASGKCHKIPSNRTASCTPTQILDKREKVCIWDRRTYHTFVFDVSLRVPVSNLAAAIQDVKKLNEFNPQKLCETGGVVMRSIKKSDAYLGPAEDMVTLEVWSYRAPQKGTPKWNEDVHEEFEQMVIEKHGGSLHWGKNGGYLFAGLHKKVVNLDAFLDVKNRFDPFGLFSSNWTNALLGIGDASVEELGDGCAFDKRCKCRQDSHCAPAKGWVCKPGKVWKNARVCGKIDENIVLYGSS